MNEQTPSGKASQDSPLVNYLCRSQRLQYLLRWVEIDGTMAIRPLSWLPILVSGPRPPTASGLHKAIRSWSRRRFPGACDEIRVEQVESPPPLLQTTGLAYCQGVALSVCYPAGDRVASLQAWLAADGSQGAYAIFNEGDEEIQTLAIEPFPDEAEAIGQLDRVACQFLDGQLFPRAFEDWLESYSSDWTSLQPEVSTAIADRQNGQSWCYALVPHGGKTIILGCSNLNSINKIEVGVFFADHQGVLVSQHLVGFAESPPELCALLTKSFGKSPEDTVLAAWMLHRVVPPLQPAN